MSLAIRGLFKKNCIISMYRGFHQSASLGEKRKVSELEKINFKLAGYNKYGLLKDDIVNDFDPNVQEAIRRMPEDLQMARKHRAIRASQLVLSSKILPEEEWSKIDDDHEYLQPYLQEVLQEIQEREDWDATH